MKNISSHGLHSLDSFGFRSGFSSVRTWIARSCNFFMEKQMFGHGKIKRLLFLTLMWPLLSLFRDGLLVCLDITKGGNCISHWKSILEFDLSKLISILKSMFSFHFLFYIKLNIESLFEYKPTFQLNKDFQIMIGA